MPALPRHAMPCSALLNQSSVRSMPHPRASVKSHPPRQGPCPSQVPRRQVPASLRRYYSVPSNQVPSHVLYKDCQNQVSGRTLEHSFVQRLSPGPFPCSLYGSLSFASRFGTAHAKSTSGQYRAASAELANIRGEEKYKTVP